MNNLDNLERLLERLMKSPCNAEIYNDIGVFLCQMKDWTNAELYLRRAYELDPSFQDIMYNYASILYYRFKWKKAVPIFNAYLEANPKDKEIGVKIADAYFRLEKYEEAAKAYASLN